MPHVISIKTNRKEIAIERDGEIVGSVWFDPTDMALLSRLSEVQQRMKELALDIPADAGVEEGLEAVRAADAEIREALDYAFDYPCSEVVFGNSYSFSTRSGVSMLEQFLEGAAAYIRTEMEAENRAAEEKRARYTEKYKK